MDSDSLRTLGVFLNFKHSVLTGCLSDMIRHLYKRSKGFSKNKSDLQQDLQETIATDNHKDKYESDQYLKMRFLVVLS